MLEMQNVQLSRDGRQVLRLELSLSTPGITVVMGPNGAGKSLFLQVAHGLIAPDAGAVLWNGEPAATSKRQRGFVFQTTPVLRRSVAENLRFPLRVAGLEEGARVQEALRIARLETLADAPAAVLSGGELGRMALARALMLEPKAVLLDEPGAALDPSAAKALELMMRKVSARGVKVLIATHDLGQARRLADDVLFFDDGHLIAQAQATAFFKDPVHPRAHGYLKGDL